jgi:hypothetical protein
VGTEDERKTDAESELCDLLYKGRNQYNSMRTTAKIMALIFGQNFLLKQKNIFHVFDHKSSVLIIPDILTCTRFKMSSAPYKI